MAGLNLNVQLDPAGNLLGQPGLVANRIDQFGGGPPVRQAVRLIDRVAPRLARELRRRARERDFPPLDLERAAPAVPDEGGALRGAVQLARGTAAFITDRLQREAYNVLGVGLGIGGFLLRDTLLGGVLSMRSGQEQISAPSDPDRDPGDPGGDPNPEPQSGGFHKKKRPRFTGRGFRLGETPLIPGGGFTPWDEEVAFKVPDRGFTPYSTYFEPEPYNLGIRRSWQGRRVTSEYDPGAPGQLITQMPPELFREPLVRDREVLRQAVPYPPFTRADPTFYPVFRGNRARTGTRVRAEPVPASHALVTADYYQQLSLQQLAGDAALASDTKPVTERVKMEAAPQATPTVVNYVAPAGAASLATAAGGGADGGGDQPRQFDCALCARDGFVMGVGLGTLAWGF